jgi:tRNA U34 2-thiouridine synthase MnmA/TrmU
MTDELNLPLGGMVKTDVVRYVVGRGLPCRPQRKSQDLCFVGEAGHGVWIDLRSLDAPPPGDFVDQEGRRLGRHRGIHHYTVALRDDGAAEVEFETPQFAIAPGQAVAFYEGDEVLGSGWIADWSA